MPSKSTTMPSDGSKSSRKSINRSIKSESASTSKAVPKIGVKRKAKDEMMEDKVTDGSSSTQAYKIPRSIYEKALEDIYSSDKHRNKDNLFRDTRLDSHLCHINNRRYFNSDQPPDSGGNFSEAAKQAIENRDFPTLYQIISKGLHIKDPGLNQQMEAYMRAAMAYCEHESFIEESDHEDL